jgi:hypothetical protein
MKDILDSDAIKIDLQAGIKTQDIIILGVVILGSIIIGGTIVGVLVHAITKRM